MLNFISVIKCSQCGSIRTMITGTEELEFYPNGTGIYSPYIQCLDCKNGFIMEYEFDYDITKQSVR